MKKHLYATLILIGSLVLLLSLSAAAAEPESAPFRGYIIGMKDDAAPALFSGTESLEYVVPGVYCTEDERLAAAMALRPDVAYVEPNYVVELFDTPTTYACEPAWSYEFLGGPKAESLGLTGKGVRIAVIDSGIDPTNLNLRGANILEGRNYGTLDTPDNAGHGTCVAQTIAGRGVEGLTRGLAPEAELVPLRCFGSEIYTTVGMLNRAIRDAVDEFECQILNMSWGIASDSQSLHETLLYAKSKGAVLIAAAGNAPQFPQGTILYPAAYDEVLGVGALKPGRLPAWCTQMTSAVSLCAPGEKMPYQSIAVSEKNADGTTTVVPPHRICQDGTSFAAPCVSSVAALVLQSGSGLQQEDMTDVMTTRAVDLGESGYDHTFGYGSVEVEPLFAESFCRLVREEDQVTVRGWDLNPGGSQIMAATYNAAGQMVGVGMRAITASTVNGYNFQLPGGSNQVKLFVTTGAGTAMGDPMIFDPVP